MPDPVRAPIRYRLRVLFTRRLLGKQQDVVNGKGRDHPKTVIGVRQAVLESLRSIDAVGKLKQHPRLQRHLHAGYRIRPDRGFPLRHVFHNEILRREPVMRVHQEAASHPSRKIRPNKRLRIADQPEISRLVWMEPVINLIRRVLCQRTRHPECSSPASYDVVNFFTVGWRVLHHHRVAFLKMNGPVKRIIQRTFSGDNCIKGVGGSPLILHQKFNLRSGFPGRRFQRNSCSGSVHTF